MMFDRIEAFKQAIQDKSIPDNTLKIMIDFHYQKDNFTEAQYTELTELMTPPVEPPIEPPAEG